MTEIEYQLLVNLTFLSFCEGGRKNMPVIAEQTYTYRPTIFLDRDYSVAYSAAIVIKNTMSPIEAGKEILSVPIILLHPEEVLPRIHIGTFLEFSEGPHIVAHGTVIHIDNAVVPGRSVNKIE